MTKIGIFSHHSVYSGQELPPIYQLETLQAILITQRHRIFFLFEIRDVDFTNGQPPQISYFDDAWLNIYDIILMMVANKLYG